MSKSLPYSMKDVHYDNDKFRQRPFSIYREWGWEIFEAFEKSTKVNYGGYTSLDDVTVLPPQRREKMETFFLGETLKYLNLLFGDSKVIPLDEFVFNTEAHPFPIKSTTKRVRGNDMFTAAETSMQLTAC